MTDQAARAGKLVRDRIPEIIRRDGWEPIMRIAGEDEYRHCLHAKLREELDEYFADENPGELADLIEVCFAAAAVQGVSRSDLLAMAERKREQCGGFDDRIVWLGNTAPGN
ncbi:nucleoside triphosphate pyrophosphohydrolase [Actinoplanes regularis]|uniref:nucleoside triphosphate pyrophosphohydrolase n=1 Tax=Actinoplanes regularis TaxID=52697 RepID=UPI002556E6A6|nr:nucleoside triphosphate pyrophosphohydrolase [Actinoplanes regularis]